LSAGKSTRQHVDHIGQSKSLVGLIAAEWQDCSWRITVKLIRICGRLSIGIKNPSGRNRLASDFLDAHFSFSGGTGPDIEDERTIRSARHPQADRVCTQARSLASHWGNSLSRAVRVGDDH